MRDIKEADVLKQVLGYLQAKHVFAFRLNTGAFNHVEGARFFRFHSLGPGAADIVIPAPGSIFVECKRPGGCQSPAQRLFEDRVTGEGFHYVVARSIDDLEGLL